jgi:hypothetical protein
MIYLTPQASRSLPAHYGQILTPEGGTITPTSRLFAVDNGVYTGKFAPIRFMRWLGALKPHQVRCLFVVAPDVVSDHAGNAGAIWLNGIRDSTRREGGR